MPNTDFADMHHGCTSALDGLADRRVCTAGFAKVQYTDATHDNGLAWTEALVAAMPWMILLFLVTGKALRLRHNFWRSMRGRHTTSFTTEGVYADNRVRTASMHAPRIVGLKPVSDVALVSPLEQAVLTGNKYSAVRSVLLVTYPPMVSPDIKPVLHNREFGSVL